MTGRVCRNTDRSLQTSMMKTRPVQCKTRSVFIGRTVFFSCEVFTSLVEVGAGDVVNSKNGKFASVWMRCKRIFSCRWGSSDDTKGYLGGMQGYEWRKMQNRKDRSGGCWYPVGLEVNPVGLWIGMRIYTYRYTTDPAVLSCELSVFCNQKFSRQYLRRAINLDDNPWETRIGGVEGTGLNPIKIVVKEKALSKQHWQKIFWECVDEICSY